MTLPVWVSRVVTEKNGDDVRFLFEKELTSSDVVRQQNRLLVPRSSVDRNLNDALADDEEKMAVGLMGNYCGSLDRAGMRVKAYGRNMWVFQLNMIYWSSSRGLVINGSEWQKLITFQGFTKGTKVKVWSFRTATEGGKRAFNLVIGEDDDRNAKGSPHAKGSKVND